MKKLAITILLLINLLAATAAVAWGPAKTLIAPTTEAATYILTVPEGLGSSLQLTGVLGEGESITMQRHNGTDWEQLKIDGADAKSLSSANHLISMYGAMYIRISKPVTAAAAGVDWRR